MVTGIGMVTSLGSDVKSTWKNVLGLESGVSEIKSFDFHPYPSHIAAEGIIIILILK